jgi:hypothetical protein
MQRTIVLIVAFTLLLMPLIAQAQSQNVETLGPVIICSAGDDGGTNVNIISPQGNMTIQNPVELNFTATIMTMFGQFGHIGYSIDSGIINNLKTYSIVANESGHPDWYWYKTTASAQLMLPTLTEGSHNLTVYLGYQYHGTAGNPNLERFEVYAYDSVEFTIAEFNTPDSTPSSTVTPVPTPTIPEYPIATVTILAALTVSTVILTRRRK